jgi:hypothetical protein
MKGRKLVRDEDTKRIFNIDFQRAFSTSSRILIKVLNVTVL